MYTVSDPTICAVYLQCVGVYRKCTTTLCKLGSSALQGTSSVFPVCVQCTCSIWSAVHMQYMKCIGSLLSAVYHCSDTGSTLHFQWNYNTVTAPLSNILSKLSVVLVYGEQYTCSIRSAVHMQYIKGSFVNVGYRQFAGKKLLQFF